MSTTATKKINKSVARKILDLADAGFSHGLGTASPTAEGAKQP